MRYTLRITAAFSAESALALQDFVRERKIQKESGCLLIGKTASEDKVLTFIVLGQQGGSITYETVGRSPFQSDFTEEVLGRFFHAGVKFALGTMWLPEGRVAQFKINLKQTLQAMRSAGAYLPADRRYDRLELRKAVVDTFSGLRASEKDAIKRTAWAC